MEFNEWLNTCIKTGNLCNEYKDKALSARSKMDLIRLCFDANGIYYLQEMQSKGLGLPYEVICSKFKSYIDGRYIAEYLNKKGNSYTSSLYCCFSDSDYIDIQTTITSILGCKSSIRVRENDFVRIYVDKNCELEINCPQSSRCIVEYWKGAKIVVNGNHEKVELIEH